VVEVVSYQWDDGKTAAKDKASGKIIRMPSRVQIAELCLERSGKNRTKGRIKRNQDGYERASVGVMQYLSLSMSQLKYVLRNTYRLSGSEKDYGRDGGLLKPAEVDFDNHRGSHL